MKRTAIFYLVLLVLAGLGIFALLRAGATLPPPTTLSGAGAPVAPTSLPPGESAADQSIIDSMGASLRKNFDAPLGHLFLQLLVIITVSRLAGALFTKLGQPSVVGEMAAGHGCLIRTL